MEEEIAEFRQYAGFWRRFAAMFIDSVIAGMITSPGHLARYASEVPFLIIPVMGVSYLAGLAFWLFNSVYLVGSGGASLGKMALGIKVLGENGRPIGYARAVGRDIFKIVSGLPCVCWLGFLWMLWDEHEQTWHDKVVQSYVYLSR